jgi:hypothetical protein
MKKQINYSVQFFLCVLISIQAISQTETFDIITYTPPKDWKKDAKQGVVNYTNVNATTGAFCVITIYASSASTGDAEKDFKNEWKELLVTPYKAEANPKTETETTADGWKTVGGASLVKMDGADVYIILSVYSGFGKKFSVRTSINDQTYVGEIDALFASMKLDKTKSVTPNQNNTGTVTKGGTGKFGLINYTAPDGWKEELFREGLSLNPLNLSSNEFLRLQIMQPLNFSGSLEQALQKSYDEAAALYKGTKMNFAGGAEYQKTDPQKSFKGWEYIRGKGSIQIPNETPYAAEYGLDLFVIKVNNRFERILTLKSHKSCEQSMSRYYPDEKPEYNNAIEKFLFSLQFTDLNDPGLKPGTIKGDGIVGVWEGISLSVGATSTSDPLGVRYKVFTPIFFSNGQVYFGTKFPYEGLDEFNTWIRAEKYRRDWGTYSFSNGRGVLKLPYGDLPMRMENNKYIITVNKTDHAFHKLNSVDGARFSGTYVMNEAYGKIPVITFTADGRFTDKGAIKALYHESDDCTNPGLAPGSGTYEVRNHSVLFHFSDGRKIKVAFLGAGYDIKNQSPATLTMGANEDQMRRQ